MKDTSVMYVVAAAIILVALFYWFPTAKSTSSTKGGSCKSGMCTIPKKNGDSCGGSCV